MTDFASRVISNSPFSGTNAFLFIAEGNLIVPQLVSRREADGVLERAVDQARVDELSFRRAAGELNPFSSPAGIETTGTSSDSRPRHPP